jgi:hypothetical protein
MGFDEDSYSSESSSDASCETPHSGGDSRKRNHSVDTNHDDDRREGAHKRVRESNNVKSYNESNTVSGLSGLSGRANANDSSSSSSSLHRNANNNKPEMLLSGLGGKASQDGFGGSASGNNVDRGNHGNIYGARAGMQLGGNRPLQMTDDDFSRIQEDAHKRRMENLCSKDRKKDEVRRNLIYK